MFLNVASGFFFITLLLGCAAKGVPEGGPIDDIPPEIIYTFPAADSTNIKSLSEIQIKFSESMDESSASSNIFVSPPVKFKTNWESDTELSLKLEDSLKADQTYVVVFGAEIKDLRRNKLKESFQLAFSSGPAIDKGRIAGKVYGLNRNQTISLLAYEMTSDSIRFDTTLANYISQTGANGDYLLNYMRMGTYRVFALADQNNNLKIDANFEKIGIPYLDVKLDSASNYFTGLNFKLTKVDTTAPKINNIRVINNKQINLRLSEKIKFPELNQVSIKDSIDNTPVKVLALSTNTEADNVIEVFTNPTDSGRVYLCTVMNLQDSSLNMLETSTLSFIGGTSAKVDSFQILAFTPADSTWNLHPNSAIYVEFNRPVSAEKTREALIIKRLSGDTVKGVYQQPSAFEIEYKPSRLWTIDSIYSIQLDFSKITDVWGDTLIDSTVIRHIKINNGDDYGEISGNVVFLDSLPEAVYVSAEKVGKKAEKYTGWADSKKNFKLAYVPEGNYQINAYVDKDSNNTFSGGNLFPFTYSEPFSFRPDTIKVRKRWETSDIIIELPATNKK